jgi:O-antigen ligase
VKTTLSPTLASALSSPWAIAAALLAALAVIGALALLMRRRQEAFPLLAIFALPFRLPISADGRTVNLLIPLYLVVAAGTLAHLVPRWLGRRASEGPARSPIVLEWLLLGAVALYVVQGVYSTDHAKAAENVAFFYIPFGLLFMLLRDVRWTRELVLACLGVAVALAVVFAGVGFVEYYRKTLFLNPKVGAANQYGNYFRVNSLFFDPSIYGRFLAIVMIAVTTGVLWNGSGSRGRGRGRRSGGGRSGGESRSRRELLFGAGVLAWLLGGLITSFSQSSIVALLLGLAVLAACRWDRRATLYVAIAAAAIAAVVVVTAPPSLHFGLNGSGGSTSNATSGRTKLIYGGLELFAKRPLEGYGSGSFETEYKRHRKASAGNATSASHTIPVTVAAEQGILGLVVYVALLIAAFTVLFAGAGRSPPRIAIAACFAALVLHTWTYADFLEDPITWTLLGIGVALARGEGVREGGGRGQVLL